MAMTRRQIIQNLWQHVHCFLLFSCFWLCDWLVGWLREEEKKNMTMNDDEICGAILHCRVARIWLVTQCEGCLDSLSPGILLKTALMALAPTDWPRIFHKMIWKWSKYFALYERSCVGGKSWLGSQCEGWWGKSPVPLLTRIRRVDTLSKDPQNNYKLAKWLLQRYWCHAFYAVNKSN